MFSSLSIPHRVNRRYHNRRNGVKGIYTVESRAAVRQSDGGLYKAAAIFILPETVLRRVTRSTTSHTGYFRAKFSSTSMMFPSRQLYFPLWSLKRCEHKTPN